jgi:hypothetical protein
MHFFHSIFEAGAVAGGVARAWRTKRSELAIRKVATENAEARIRECFG